MHCGHAVARDEERAVEVVEVAELAEDPGGRHREAGADHVADHHPEAQAACLRSHREALGESAALVELDVDDVEEPDQRFDVGEALNALVGGDRYRAAETVEVRLVSAREGLLHELHLAGDEVRHERREARRVKPLVGVDADPGVGAGSAHRAHALGIERRFAGQFQLQRFRLRIGDGLLGHCARVVRGHGEGRE